MYCLFSVMSAVSSYLVISYRLLSVHLSLGRPLLLFPGTTTSIIVLGKLSYSLLLTCPYQCNRFCLRNVDIWHTLASSCIVLFLTWSFLVLPLIHRSILISATCNLFSSFFLTAQHSAHMSLLAWSPSYTPCLSAWWVPFCRIARPPVASISSKLV